MNFLQQHAVRVLLVSLTLSLSGLHTLGQVQFVELSHYLFPDFIQGTVFMKSGPNQETTLNYNSLTEEMLFQDKGNILAIGDDAVRNIDSIVIQGRTFVPVNGIFFELLLQSRHQLFAEHKCQLTQPGKSAGYGGTSQTTAITSIASLQADGLLYQLRLPDDYKINPYICYWLRMEDESIRFLNMRQLRQIYNKKRSLFDAFVKEHHVKYDDQQSLIQLIQYMGTL